LRRRLDEREAWKPAPVFMEKDQGTPEGGERNRSLRGGKGGMRAIVCKGGREPNKGKG